VVEDPPQLSRDGEPDGSGTPGAVDMVDMVGIVGIGMSALDSLHSVEEFPSAGGITELAGGFLSGGGPVPTALCAAARLGAACAIVERLGGDWRGDFLVADYRRHGVSVEHLSREADASTAAATVLVRRRDGERHVLFERGTATEIRPEELPREALRRCRFLHLNGHHPEASLAAARIVGESGGAVSFDGGAHRYHPRLEPFVALADILVVARDFAEQRVGPGSPADPRELVLALAETAPSASLVGVTDGERGSWLLERGDAAPWHQPACDPGEIVDTTGCGDVFHGALLAARLGGGSWREAARVASAAAALAATSLGGRGRLPRRAEIDVVLRGSRLAR